MLCYSLVACPRCEVRVCEASLVIKPELGEGRCDAWREVDNDQLATLLSRLSALVSIRLRVAMAVSNSARAASMQEPS